MFAWWHVVLLVVLAVQGSAHALSIRISRGVYHEPYSVLSTLIMVELEKLLISLLVVVHSESSKGGVAVAGKAVLDRLSRVLSVRSNILVAVPAAIYLVQTQLAFFALKNLDSATYAALAQLKLLTAAVFAVVLLRKQLFTYQWRALLLLFVGVVMVQQQQQQLSASADSQQHAWFGTLAVLGMASCSGLAGVYVERVLKARESEFDLWDRNIQLSLYGLLFAVVSIVVTPSEYDFFSRHSFFHGYSWLTHVVIGLGSAGGLLVATVTLCLDNIMKNFASVASIVLTCLTSASVLHERQLDAPFVCGVVAVGLAMLNYTDPTAAAALTALAASGSKVSDSGAETVSQQHLTMLGEGEQAAANTADVGKGRLYTHAAADETGVEDGSQDSLLLSATDEGGESDELDDDVSFDLQRERSGLVDLEQGKPLQWDDSAGGAAVAASALFSLRPLMRLPEV